MRIIPAMCSVGMVLSQFTDLLRLSDLWWSPTFLSLARSAYLHIEKALL